MSLERITLAQVRARQPGWFSPGNRQFFQDCRYTVRYGRATGERFLLRSTYMWSDMFGEPKTLHYRLNVLMDDLEIGSLVDEIFPSRAAVTAWLRRH